MVRCGRDGTSCSTFPRVFQTVFRALLTIRSRQVVSFTNLRLSQTRNPDIPEGKKVKACGAGKEVHTGF